MYKKKIYYIAEINLPSKSAYSIHVMKMCEAFSKLRYNVNLFVISKKNYSQINNFYNIKFKFNIISIFKNFTLLNFFLRILFSSKILLKKIDKDEIFISRSIIFSLLASILKKKIILELHHEFTGVSKILFFMLKKINLINNLKFIFINKNLIKLYDIQKKNYVILDDAVNLDDFKVRSKIKFKKTCVYIGSFFKGKGIDQIFRLARKNQNINFHVYGEKKFLNIKNTCKNLKIFEHISYNNVPNTLSRYEIALMPYQNRVKGRSSISLEKYMSPLKMFDYLAAGMVIIASRLQVYKHILINNYNCKLANVNDDIDWSNKINNIIKNKPLKIIIKKNAYKTASKYTWENRCKKIIKNFF